MDADYPSTGVNFACRFTTQTFESGQVPVLDAMELLTSNVSVDTGEVEPPSAMKWEEWPAHFYDKTDRSIVRFVWIYEGGRPYFGPVSTISGNIVTQKAARLDGEKLKYPDEIHQLFAKSATLFFGSVWFCCEIFAGLGELTNAAGQAANSANWRNGQSPGMT